MSKKVNVEKGKQGFQKSTKHVNPTGSLDLSKKHAPSFSSLQENHTNSPSYNNTHNTFKELVENKVEAKEETKPSSKVNYHTPSTEGWGYSGIPTQRKPKPFRRWSDPQEEGPETKREVITRLAQGQQPVGAAEIEIRKEIIKNYVDVGGMLMRKATEDTVMKPTRAEAAEAERAERQRQAPYGYDASGKPLTKPQ